MSGTSLFVEAFLRGGAPWGFTLKGGLEHGEPLIISKVEEGGKAGSLQCPLLVGDEVIIINGVELSGFRQEAISLVKGSYKTLQLTVRREHCADLCCSETLTPSPSHQADTDRCSKGVQIRIKHRSSEPVSRPHSWHSAKVGEGPLDSGSMMQISQGAMGAPWHQSYHASASTTDLSSYDAGYLRKSPDQYSSRGSMESLDHSHPAYSSCNQLSVSKSSNSIDHLHSKRDSAYSSFSTSSSIPEYLAAGPSFSKERSYSMDSVPQHRTTEGMHQADIRYVRTVYDSQQGVSAEQEVLSAAGIKTNETKGQSRCGSTQDRVCHRSNSTSGSNNSSGNSHCGTVTSHRHSAGPAWGQTHNDNSYDNLKGAPSPPLRSDSYAATRNHERPSSWSSLEQARSLRALQKGSWHHSSGSVASGKPSFGIEGQLHTVIEKSPESSPTVKPKQSLPPLSQPGSAMLPTSIYPVPLPEPHFAQMPTTIPSSSTVYPALAKESKPIPQKEHCGETDSDVRMTTENGYQSTASYSNSVQSLVFPQPKQTNQVKDDPQTKCGFYRSHFHTQGSKPQVLSIGQERKDPYTPVQPRREKPRYSHGMDVMESYRQPREEELSRCQEQNVHLQPFYSLCEVVQEHALPQGNDQRINTSGRFHNEPNTYQQRDQDLDHPLTRLENALVEVQRCDTPQSTTSSNQIERSMSVMEKVSHFERQQTKPRSHSHTLSNYSSSVCPSQATPSIKWSLSGLQKGYVPQGRCWGTRHEGNAESLQDLQPGYVSTDQAQHRKPHDLHRSKSSFQLNEENGQDFHRSKSTFHLEENSKDIQWKEGHQDILGTVPDTTCTRAYRDSIKDAQSKVLRSTSFRRRDLNINPPPVPAKHMSLDRKGTNTCPKPTSPHTPKERHVIPIELPDKATAPELPRVPPVGPTVMRICGRKRLTMEQKKLSYSEPENIHEVGTSDQESSLFQRKVPPQFQLPETSVADRRRMFELVATRSSGTTLGTSKPELKQMQQDALADYVERKTGRRMEGRLHRPHSAYMQSTSCLAMDSQSRTSTTSMSSLQEPGRESISEVNRQSFTLTANTQYPLHSKINSHTRSKSENYHPSFRPQIAEPQKPERQAKRIIPNHAPDPNLAHSHNTPASQSLDEIFEKAVSARSSGKSASAEDLLDRKEGHLVSQHFRSKSSPTVENHNLDALAKDLRLFGSVSKVNRASSVAPEQRSLSEVGLERSSSLNPGLNQAQPPVIRRERQRHSDRPRSHSASGLAASVGLPCPFSSSEWQRTNNTQCQPNLDAITFPGTVPENETIPFSEKDNQNSANATSSKEAPNNLEKTDHDLSAPHQGVAESLTSFSFNPPHEPCHSGLPTSPKDSPKDISPIRSLHSLRISESSLGFAQSVSQEEDDDVFLTPTSPPLNPLSRKEGNLSEEPSLPYPSDQSQIKEEALGITVFQESQKMISTSEHPSVTTTHQERDGQLHNLLTLSVTTDPNIIAVISEAETEELSESHELPLLARRERTEVEIRVETLARELVSRDEALVPLLDIWASTTTLDLMEDIFPFCSSGPWHQGKNGSSHAGDSVKNTVCVPPEDHASPVQGKIETNLDEEESNFNEKKVELLQVLTSSIEALRTERERLAEEQQCYCTLGCRIEALVQEHCKPNETDKYRMFIGDLEKIVNLLLSLSGRLARVENALNVLQGEPEKGSDEEKASLQQKQMQLRSQQEDARELKENLDRRERIVLQFLSGYLSTVQLQDYRRYIRAKPALLIRQRHLDELIRQGEEQLCRLSEITKQELNPETGFTPSSCSDSFSSTRPTAVTSL
ncbi:protein Shroom3 isoform X2 [Clarias gariepinus]|uniref:protein Shroom3 isoform X2 n=1 Tax=Clarias gariepinus TaxID=13013 RepID=UPI00234DAFAA|nr:protein Shroom3 isoform X2 [Clarias gariepinus]